MFIRALLISLALSISGTGVMVVAAQPAYATSKAAVAPEIDDVVVTSENGFKPGTELTFTLEGTPKGKAKVRVSGISRNIILTEVSRGVYEGYHTISTKDRMSANSTLRATLTVRGRSATARQLLSATATGAPATANAGNMPAQSERMTIGRFTGTPVDKIEPGVELKFAMSGTPNAKASFAIEGIAKDVPMQEIRSGQYEGSYTVRRSDKFPANPNVSGTLSANGQVSTTRLAQPLTPDVRSPIANLSPRDGAIVKENPVLISATFADQGGPGIDPKTVRILLSGTDVSANATITPHFFNLRTDLRSGTYPVEVTARDTSGRMIRQSWKFTVAAQGAQAMTTLPLQITSHANNAQVTSGVVEVQGRTAPDARVDVQVQAIAQVVGGFGFNQPVFDQSLRADSNGNFFFSFQSPIPIPGTRYEITLSASKANLTKETKLVLFQQR